MIPNTISERKDLIWKILEQVPDPEIPVLSAIDLGIIREVILHEDLVEIIITPTYTGCPAMNMIAVNIKTVLQENGFQHTKVTSVLSPSWTTDWMSETGKQKLKEYGIAPPVGKIADKNVLLGEEKLVKCPLCGSNHTEMVSQFGSTACKSLYRCLDCKEPFDYFKCH